MMKVLNHQAQSRFLLNILMFIETFILISIEFEAHIFCVSNISNIYFVSVTNATVVSVNMVTRASNNLSSALRRILHPKRFIIRLFPIIQWSRSYDSEKAIGDLIAGGTVAFILIPQSMAFSVLAGFAPQYGLYGSFMGGFVYALMGNCPQVSIGPTALLSLLTFTHTNGTNIDFAVLLCLMTGIIQLVAGVSNLGFLMDFVSVPVLSGFTSAASCIVASSQIKGLLGLHFGADTFVDTWKNIIKHIHETRMPDTVLSLTCCTVLTVMQHQKKYIHIKQPQNEKEKRSVAKKNKSLWLLGVSRNVVVLILASLVAFIMYNDLNNPFLLTGPITPGLPSPQLPVFESQVGNKAYKAGDMLSHLGLGLIIIPLMGILVNVTMAKIFAKGKRVDTTQEILALAVCNIVNSFFLSIPVNGAISRCAVSDASGVKTPISGVYASILVILTLLLLTPYFYYIPRAALASVVVCAVLQMVDIAILKKLWKVNRLDLIPLIGCFFCSLGLGIEVGLLCGVGFDVMLLLYYNSRPPLDINYIEDGSLLPHYAIHPVGRLSFAGAERVYFKLSSLIQSETISVSASNESGTVNGSRKMSPEVLVVYCDALYRLDYTFLQRLKMLETYWHRYGLLIFCNAKPAVKEQLCSVLKDSIYCDSTELGAHLAITDDEEQHSAKDTDDDV